MTLTATVTTVGICDATDDHELENRLFYIYVVPYKERDVTSVIGYGLDDRASILDKARNFPFGHHCILTEAHSLLYGESRERYG
jgi:hypothetical protein